MVYRHHHLPLDPNFLSKYFDEMQCDAKSENVFKRCVAHEDEISAPPLALVMTSSLCLANSSSSSSNDQFTLPSSSSSNDQFTLPSSS